MAIETRSRVRVKKGLTPYGPKKRRYSEESMATTPANPRPKKAKTRRRRTINKNAPVQTTTPKKAVSKKNPPREAAPKQYTTPKLTKKPSIRKPTLNTTPKTPTKKLTLRKSTKPLDKSYLPTPATASTTTSTTTASPYAPTRPPSPPTALSIYAETPSEETDSSSDWDGDRIRHLAASMKKKAAVRIPVPVPVQDMSIEEVVEKARVIRGRLGLGWGDGGRVTGVVEVAGEWLEDGERCRAILERARAINR